MHIERMTFQAQPLTEQFEFDLTSDQNVSDDKFGCVYTYKSSVQTTLRTKVQLKATIIVERGSQTLVLERALPERMLTLHCERRKTNIL